MPHATRVSMVQRLSDSTTERWRRQTATGHDGLITEISGRPSDAEIIAAKIIQGSATC